MTFSRVALLGACALVAHMGAASARPVPGTPCTVLPADNIWNRDISAMPVHARSAAWLQSTNAASARLHCNGCSGKTLAPGSSCTIGLRFIPKALGTRTAWLRIAHSAADGRASVKLSGTGIQ